MVIFHPPPCGQAVKWETGDGRQGGRETGDMETRDRETGASETGDKEARWGGNKGYLSISFHRQRVIKKKFPTLCPHIGLQGGTERMGGGRQGDIRQRHWIRETSRRGEWATRGTSQSLKCRKFTAFLLSPHQTTSHTKKNPDTVSTHWFSAFASMTPRRVSANHAAGAQLCCSFLLPRVSQFHLFMEIFPSRSKRVCVQTFSEYKFV